MFSIVSKGEEERSYKWSENKSLHPVEKTEILRGTIKKGRKVPPLSFRYQFLPKEHPTNQQPKFSLTGNFTELFGTNVNNLSVQSWQEFQRKMGTWTNHYRKEGRHPWVLQVWKVLKTLANNTERAVLFSQGFRSECSYIQEGSHKLSWLW